MNNELLQLRKDLLQNHWEDAYDWVGIENDLQTVARMHGCSVEDVRAMMRDIEQKNPKPKRKKD